MNRRTFLSAIACAPAALTLKLPSQESSASLPSSPAEDTPVRSGFQGLDTMLEGFRPGELTIIAGRPSMGKTAFALGMTRQACLRDRKSVTFFTIETTQEKTARRLLQIESGVALRRPYFDRDHLQLVASAAERVSPARLFFCDEAPLRVQKIAVHLENFKKTNGAPELVIVDYLQLLKDDRKFLSRREEVDGLCTYLIQIATRLNVPIVALAQLNRHPSDRKPTLADLRESNGIKEIADNVLLLYRDNYYDTDAGPSAEVIVAKNRRGTLGTIPLRFDTELGRFTYPNHADRRKS